MLKYIITFIFGFIMAWFVIDVHSWQNDKLMQYQINNQELRLYILAYQGLIYECQLCTEKMDMIINGINEFPQDLSNVINENKENNEYNRFNDSLNNN